MANSLISMIKGNSTLINNTEVLNGQVLFDTDEKSILLDDNNTRSEYCGADKSNKNLASIENGTTASKGYSAGSYVVWKGQLYKVTRQINSGTAFNIGYNITSDTVGAELTSHASSISTLTSELTNITNGYKYKAFTNPVQVTTSGVVISLDSTMTAYNDILLYGGINTLNSTFVTIRFFKRNNSAFGFNSFWTHTQYVAGNYIYFTSPSPNITIKETHAEGVATGSFYLYGYFYR